MVYHQEAWITQGKLIHITSKQLFIRPPFGGGAFNKHIHLHGLHFQPYKSFNLLDDGKRS